MCIVIALSENGLKMKVSLFITIICGAISRPAKFVIVTGLT